MRPLRAAVVLASLVVAAAGCSGLLGDFSLGTGEDGGSEGGPAGEGGGDSGTGDGKGPDAGDATTGDGQASDGPVGDGKGVESGTTDGGEAGGVLTCTLALAGQRQLNATGTTISADNLRVYNTSQTNVLALAMTSQPPALAYSFRSDRPTDAPQLVQIQGPGGPARIMSTARSVAGTETYVLADDNGNNVLFYDWLDSAGIGASPTATTETTPFDMATMAPTSQGIFYEYGVSGQTYVDYEVPPTPMTYSAIDVPISAQDQGLTDGTHVYRLSDDSLSVLFTTPDGMNHQSHYGPNSATLVSTRDYFAQPMLPFVFAPDGTSVDIGTVEFASDASYGLFTATVPESQLFTFDLTTSQFELPSTLGISNTSCAAAYPGKLLALLPQTAGMDLYVVDMATGSVDYSLTGASNLLHGDDAIVGCAIAPASITSNQLTFEVIWTDNVGGGPQNLSFVPLECTIQ